MSPRIVSASRVMRLSPIMMVSDSKPVIFSSTSSCCNANQALLSWSNSWLGSSLSSILLRISSRVECSSLPNSYVLVAARSMAGTSVRNEVIPGKWKKKRVSSFNMVRVPHSDSLASHEICRLSGRNILREAQVPGGVLCSDSDPYALLNRRLSPSMAYARDLETNKRGRHYLPVNIYPRINCGLRAERAFLFSLT